MDTNHRPLPPQPPPLHELLAGRALEYGERPLALFDDRTLSVRALEHESKCIAAALQGYGVKKGDPVMIVVGNRSEFLTTFFATAFAGAIAVPVNVALKGESLAHLFRVTRARIAVIEAEFLPRVQEALAGSGGLEQVFVVAGEPATQRERPFAELATCGDPLTPVPVGRGDPCSIMFTSGTTGVAKGVTIPHQQMSSAAWDGVEFLEIDETSVFYTFNPLFHLNGLVFGPMCALLGGAQTVVRHAFPREQTLQDLRDVGATHWSTMPYLARKMLAAEERPDDADNALRIVMTFGLSADEVSAFQRRFDCRLMTGYGSTEAGMMCRLQSERPTTAGRVSDRCDMRIVDSSGHDVPAGEVGEIWARIRQPFDGMLGYYNMPEATAQAFSGEWFRTGDLGRLDEEGYLHFADRLKESLKRRGENISTYEVEQAVMTFPGISTAAVVGYRSVPDAEEEVRVFIEIGDDAAAAAFDYAGLIRHCGDNLAYFMVPRFVDLVPALPRTSLGKIQKQELKTVPLSPATFDAKAAGITVER
jgi:crotonobetaine/carnitine-CoA ligase